MDSEAIIPPEYSHVGVDAARAIGHHHDKDIVIIIAYDRKSNLFNGVTWGRSMADKYFAAEMCPQLVKMLGGQEQGKYFEDFRTRTQAEWAAEKDKLMIRIAELEVKLARATEARNY